MKIERLSALQSNYIFVLISSAGDGAVVIDPGRADPVLRRLGELELPLTAIWHTHHHHDHIGGDRQLLARYPNARVFGSAHDAERIPTLTDFVAEGDSLTVGDRTAVVMEVPGHTLGHVAYYFPPALDAAPDEAVGAGAFGDLFCGDTLFSAGCGRLFEGTPVQMMRSLDKFRQLPNNTRIWCAHEYTEGNLNFACSIVPDDPDVIRYRREIQKRRQRREATVPTCLATEKEINLFLRWDDPQVQQAMGTPDDPVRTFARLRGRKDLF
ncbi:MAG: hydroxyacylglutathione hydrolase [Cyanobacteria bacterium P01_C01_bin.89]